MDEFDVARFAPSSVEATFAVAEAPVPISFSLRQLHEANIGSLSSCKSLLRAAGPDTDS